jgi:hypothetical protein
MPDPGGHVNHLFIVRLWPEGEGAAGVQWRGSVEHTASGLRLYFVSLRDLTDFITLRLHGSLPDGQTGSLELQVKFKVEGDRT